MIRKQTLYSSINIGSLAFGLSAVIMIALFLQSELSYDRFHQKGSSIVRLTYKLEAPNSTRYGAKLPFPVKNELIENYPEIDRVARFYYWSGDTPLLEYDNNKNSESGIYFAENDVFNVFDFELISGNKDRLLTDPRSIVLTEKLAYKYFGDEDPLGKVMKYKIEDLLVVTGVLKNIPEQSHIKFDALLPIELQRQRWMGWGQYTYDLEKDWNWAAAWTYALLSPNANRDQFNNKLQEIAKTHFNTEEQSGFSIETQPLYDIHLHSNKSAEASTNGSMIQLYTFAAVASLILLIACINFVNITSAQINQRLKEMGLRKVLGAGRTNLVGQFLVESLMKILASAILAFVITLLVLPYFNEFTGKRLNVSIGNGAILLFTCGIIIMLITFSIIRPIYTATRISIVRRFSLIQSKNKFSRILIIGQFVICNLLFIGIVVIHDQLSYLQNKDLGFDKEHMLILKHGRNLSKDQYEIFENHLNELPEVKSIYRGYIAGTSSFTNTFKIVGHDDQDSYSLGIKWINQNFVEMFELKLVVGRNLDRNMQSDLNTGVLINEAAVKALNWEIEDCVGKQLSFLPGGASSPEIIQVVGVLSNANFESLYDPVMPSIFRMTQSPVGSEVCLKLSGNIDVINAMDKIEESWNSTIPEWPFEVTFLDRQIGKQYVKEERLSNAISFFTFLAVLIAASGLFGLTSMVVQQKTKEIGIRKVMGASVSAILNLLGKSFLIMLVLSLLISTPLGHYFVEQWLQGFTYRIDVSLFTYIIAAWGSFLMVLLTIGSQSLTAAKRNPVEALRYE